MKVPKMFEGNEVDYQALLTVADTAFEYDALPAYGEVMPDAMSKATMPQIIELMKMFEEDTGLSLSMICKLVNGNPSLTLKIDLPFATSDIIQ